MFEAECDALLFRLGDDAFPAFDAVTDGGFVGDAGFAHAGERDDLIEAVLGGELDTFEEFRFDRVVVGWVEGALGEAVATAEGDLESELADGGVMFRADALHGDEADIFAMAGQFHGGHGIKRPAHDGLADAAIGDLERGEVVDGVGCAGEDGWGAGGGESGGAEEAASAGALGCGWAGVHTEAGLGFIG
ncbi:MAG: hypothetical protein RI897_3455 [Verrucomicrobiota bacterium]